MEIIGHLEFDGKSVTAIAARTQMCLTPATGEVSEKKSLCFQRKP